jgi:hypothetical protein
MRRPLSAREEGLLRFLASDGRDGERLLASLPHLRVVGRCDRGCGSVALEDSRGADDWERQDEFAEAVHVSDGSIVHVLVDLDTMVPTSLEVYGGERADGAGLPAAEELQLLPPDKDDSPAES